ncbi:protein phosphatase 2C domain-containing protein [Candidatus Saccharibacteria bacterium]|nr:protein phosphatase 2C domain-containing protein [Candidatus Saccharibacteria bacterium]
MDNSESGLEIDFGVSEISLAELKGKDGESEDCYLADRDLKFFALFDGLDGEKGSHAVAELALKTTKNILAQYEVPTTSSNLAWMMERINDILRESGEVGGTSCILARVVEGVDAPKLIFAAMGDSRIYLRKNGQAFQVTFDDDLRQKDLDAMKIFDPEKRKELMETKVRKYLNSGDKFEISYNNSGEVALNKGDRILICSDGVTGETDGEKLSTENITAIFGREFDDETTARVFVRVARKMDDRTAIVISVR